MGVDRAYVSSIERGQQNATIMSVWQASLALKVRPMVLLDAKGDSTSPKRGVHQKTANKRVHLRS